MKKIAILMVVCLGFVVVGMAQVPTYVPTNGLQAWYGFNGNTNDESGNGNNGTNYSAALDFDRHGIANSAYYFNGAFMYIKVDVPSFTFDATGAFTYSLWMKKTANAGVAMMMGSTAANDFVSLIGGGTTNFYFGTNKQSFSWVWATCPYDLNQWDHYVGTYDNGTMNLYKNGFFQSTALFTYTGVNATNLPLYIGKDVTTEYFSGNLDDIGIWNRALNVTEIQNLFNSCEMAITTQPQNQIVNLTDTAEFTVASNYANATYQWQKENGSIYQNISNGGQYTGVTSNTLKVMNAVFTNNNSKFRCVVSSGACLDTSAIAILTVNNNVGIANPATSSQFSLFPNPANDFLTLTTSGQATTFTITDANARQVLNGPITAKSQQLNISSLPAGNYVISVNGDFKGGVRFAKR